MNLPHKLVWKPDIELYKRLALLGVGEGGLEKLAQQYPFMHVGVGVGMQC